MRFAITANTSIYTNINAILSITWLHYTYSFCFRLDTARPLLDEAYEVQSELLGVDSNAAQYTRLCLETVATAGNNGTNNSNSNYNRNYNSDMSCYDIVVVNIDK